MLCSSCLFVLTCCFAFLSSPMQLPTASRLELLSSVCTNEIERMQKMDITPGKELDGFLVSRPAPIFQAAVATPNDIQFTKYPACNQSLATLKTVVLVHPTPPRKDCVVCPIYTSPPGYSASSYTQTAFSSDVPLSSSTHFMPAGGYIQLPTVACWSPIPQGWRNNSSTHCRTSPTSR